MTLMVTDDQ